MTVSSAVQVRSAVQILDPVEFLQPNRRILIDTNIFMDTHPRRVGGLKRLFERGQGAILGNGNPIVVPTKVIDELRKHSGIDPSTESAERAEAIKKATDSLRFLEDASKHGLVRKDLGDDSNPYADDLFLRLFGSFADTYEMCLLTNDITVKLRIRLLGYRQGKNLVAGGLNQAGDIVLESDQTLFEKGLRKHAKFSAIVAKSSGSLKEKSELATLKPLLDDFGQAFGLTAPDATLGRRVGGPTNSRLTQPPRTRAFTAKARIQPNDSPLTFSAIPKEGDQVTWESASGSGTLVLGSMLGEGGEGSVYAGGSTTVVKIFDKNHLTRHRKEKIELLVSHGLQSKGLCIPSASVKNQHGDFVGYVMPKASGREFQRTIFNKRKFVKEYPDWKKADLVDICISFLEKVQYLHRQNIILGDINPKNLMIDDKKNVFIIDADSWQIEGYPCPVGTPMFTSPRMQGTTYSENLRTMDDELFAVATMLFMIVMTGQFPYIRTGTDGDMVQLIKEGNFAFQYEDRNNRDQPDGDWKYMWSHIHKPVKGMFWHTFHKEGNRYKKRPTATEWLEAFREYKAYLGNKRKNFDPMSNEVYPTRFKAFKPDTPIQDCPNCGRKHAIAGIWNDDDEDYFVPKQCNKCKDAQPTGPPVSRPGTPTTSHCKDCGTSTLRAQLKYGRCRTCAQRDDQRQARARTIDPSRLCERCGKPFISYGNVEWHQKSGKTVPTTHKRSPGGSFPAECVPLPPTAAAQGSQSASGQKSGGGCFVATAVYGSYDCPEVWVLRRWRDSTLLRTRRGRTFVRAYYATSPKLVDLLGDKRWFVRTARGPLDMLVNALVQSGLPDDPYRDSPDSRSPVNNVNTELGEI